MNPLYNHFSRTGCFLCPKQNKSSLYALYKHYKKEWQIMKELEDTAKKLNCVNTTFKLKPLHEYEKEFELKDKQGVLFDDESYTEYDTCFCGK